uniref:Prenylcysteine oxidase n=1 Tax=Caligus clemensi TaxID=344056 RepID=C1C0G2_CALCM|nr:Prenylcysteine oxidase precursor [Caligus clemensi]
MKRTSLFLNLIAQLWTSPRRVDIANDSLRVAIIGSGIGGASTAFFLRQNFAQRPLSIDVYDPGSIGGRMATVEMAGREYEVGGSVIHSRNLLMKQFLEIVGLKPNSDLNERIAIIGKKDEVLFNELPWIGSLQMLYRYGPMTLMKLHYFIESMLKEFHKIYDFLDNGQSFNSPRDFILAISPRPKRKKLLKGSDSFVNLTKISIGDLLHQMDFPSNLINELVSVAMRCNYGQSVKDVHAFVGMVSLAGSDGSLWSVRGGNKLIPERLLKQSNVRLLKENITDIQSVGDGYFLGTEKRGHRFYDAVVIATPLTSDINAGLSLPDDIPKVPGKYHLTVTTIVHGTRNPEFFPEVSADFFLYSDDDSVINSINLLKPVDYSPNGGDYPSVWKIFSQRVLSEDEIYRIFSVVHSKKVIPWLAYPDYRATHIKQGASFPNHNHLYYINGIEWAASAMEMSAIGGKKYCKYDV